MLEKVFNDVANVYLSLPVHRQVTHFGRCYNAQIRKVEKVKKKDEGRNWEIKKLKDKHSCQTPGGQHGQRLRDDPESL